MPGGACCRPDSCLCQPTNRPSLPRLPADSEGRYSAALFVQSVPYGIKGSSWEAEEAGYVQKLLGILDSFAPGASELVVDTFTLNPTTIESYFGISRGHIHHVDNSFGEPARLLCVSGRCCETGSAASRACDGWPHFRSRLSPHVPHSIAAFADRFPYCTPIQVREGW